MGSVDEAIGHIRAHGTSVSIVGQGITDADVKRLVAVLATSDCMTELNLSCNRCAAVAQRRAASGAARLAVGMYAESQTKGVRQWPFCSRMASR